MKTTLLILTIIFSSAVWSAPVKVTLLIKDAITFKMVPDVHIIILSDEGVELGKGKSDQKGIIYVAIEMPKKTNEIKVRFVDEMEKYAPREVFLFKGKGTSISSEISLVPSEKTYAMWYAKDDSTYGGDKDGVLAPEFNTNGLICGCDVSNLKQTEFIGGQEQMFNFINNRLRYPQESIEMNEQGKVYMKFIVEEDGKLTHIQIEHGTSSAGLNAEAYRVVRSMPNWTPAECAGKKIRMYARLPFNFTLN